MDKTTLGDRMKRYEQASRFVLTRRMPVIIRVDGRAFHTYTKGFDRPFDDRIILTMVEAAQAVANEIQGLKVGYVQSDEASFLLTDYDKLETEGWFDYNVQKMCSIAASVMTANFNRQMVRNIIKFGNGLPDPILSAKIAYFDARAFNIPREDVVNYFLWRCRDWARNSVQMYARSHFSQKQLQGKKVPDMHEMLHGIGRNWATDLDNQKKNGTFIFSDFTSNAIKHNYEEINNEIESLIYPSKNEEQ